MTKKEKKTKKNRDKKQPPAPKNGELVVFLHGILLSGKSMNRLRGHLDHNGYDVVKIDYPSTRHTLEELTGHLHESFSLSDRFNKASRVHFVTHSMGGVLMRYYLHKHRPANLGHVIMMGTPNHGSEMVDYLMSKKRLRNIFNSLFGPAGAQLATTYKHLEKEKIDYSVGVIAGSRSINPVSRWVLERPNDGVVPVSRTKLDGMADHIVIRVDHNLMPLNPTVMRQTLHFLKNGKFDRTPAP